MPEHFEQIHIPKGKRTVADIWKDLPSSSDKNIFVFAALYNELFQSKYTPDLLYELSQRRFGIIHLTRDNLLRRFLSLKLAEVTGLWTGPKPSSRKLKLNALELLSDIRLNLRRAEKIRALLGHLPFLEITYENLAADFGPNFARICEFLGVRHEELRPLTVKQETRPLKEAIANYRSLKLLFALSKYRYFFDE